MLKKRLKSFKFAIDGLNDLFKTQPNAKVHLFIGLLTIIGGFILDINPAEWATLFVTIAIVIAAEAFNTALEYLTDLVSPDYHPLAGKTKDVAAAGVLICAIGAVAVGIAIFGPKLYKLLF